MNVNEDGTLDGMEPPELITTVWTVLPKVDGSVFLDPRRPLPIRDFLQGVRDGLTPFELFTDDVDNALTFSTEGEAKAWLLGCGHEDKFAIVPFGGYLA